MISKHLLLPCWEVDNVITSIDHNEIYIRGLRSLLLDVDGTLLSKNSSCLDKNVFSWVQKLKKVHKIYLISNNPSFSRIQAVAKELDLPFIHKALKPRTYFLIKALNEMGSDINEAAIIGDRIFTDVLAGNRIGIYTILVRSIEKGNRYKYNKTHNVEKFISSMLGAYKK